MTFVWPLALLSLLVVPVLLGMYWWSQRRRRKQAVRYSSVALLRSVLPKRKRWQRHLPIALLLAALVALGISAGRPHVVREVPIARTSIILALDVSRSMCSTDVKPNRLAVAQEAARAFVQKQPQGIRMGLVVFSGFAELTVPPTTDRKALVEAIDGLTTGHGTAIGSAMLKGLDAIAEANPNVAPVGDAPETEPPATRLEPVQPAGQRLRAGHHRAPHRRRQQPRDRAARCGSLCGRAPRARVSDRLRHRQPVAAVVHA